MSLLSIAQGLAKNVGLAVPSAVATSGDREWIEFVQIANQAGEELARRADWGQLTESVTLTSNGTFTPLTLPEYFSRIIKGRGVGGARPLDRAEWSAIENFAGTSPRYYLLEDQKISFYPYLANGQKTAVYYQTAAWCSNGTDEWQADAETSKINEDLFLKCVIVRWRRQKGMDYADYEAEYEATLRDLAAFNDRSRL